MYRSGKMKNIILWFTTLLLVWSSCKTTKKSTQNARIYDEDISFLRIGKSKEFDSKKDKEVEVETISDYEVSGSLLNEIDSVLYIYKERNLQKKYWKGYTIQIYNGLDRQQALAAKVKFDNLNLGFDSDYAYLQPNFKVRCGSFFSQIDAQQSFAQVREYFPNALLLPETIKINGK